MQIEIAYFVLCLSGLVLTIQDFKQQNVSVIPVLGFLLSSIYIGWLSRSFCFAPTLIVCCIGCGFYFIKKQTVFGLADYIIIFAISFLLPDNDTWPFFIIFCGSFGVLISILTQSRKFPFIPGILMSTVFTNALDKFCS